MIRQLRLRLTIVCITITSIILISLFLLTLSISERDFVKTRGEDFDNKVAFVALYFQNNPQYIEWSYLAQAEAAYHIEISVEENDQTLLFGNRSVSRGTNGRLDELYLSDNYISHKGALDYATGSNYISYFEYFNDQKYYIGLIHTQQGVNGRYITVISDTRLEMHDIVRRRVTYISALVVAIFFLSVFSWWFSGKAVVPVQKSMKQQRDFVAAASHELRTPVAAMDASVETLQLVKGEKDRIHFLSIIKKEITLTVRLINDLLMLANIDADNGWRLVLGPVEVQTLLNEVITSFRPRAQSKGITITRDPPVGQPVIEGDYDRLRQVIYIALDNALQYANTEILVSAYRRGNKLHILIADDGPGIPDEEKNRVFDRFYRVDKAHSDHAHYGLGLSIAWELVGLHKGKIALENSAKGRGLTVHITLSTKIGFMDKSP